MNRLFRLGNCWPRGQHLLLMKAALLDGDDALQAWEKWIANIDIDKLDYPSYQILPILYQHLLKLRVQHPAMNIFKGIHQRNWADNQKMMLKLSDLLKRLYASGVNDIVLMKGAAMILSYYPDFGIRVMGDVDFLIHESCISNALSSLHELGFTGEEVDHKINTQHAVNMTGNAFPFEGLNIDVHWSMLYQIPVAHADARWFTTAETVQLHGVSMKVLSPTFLLYQTCIHGAKYSLVPLTRWVMDAYTIIKIRGSDIDWELLVERAQYDRLVLPLLETLSFLKNEFQVHVPEHVLFSLRTSNVLRYERWHFTLSQYRWLSLLLVFPRLWIEHKKTAQQSFLVFLANKFGLNHPWKLIYFLPYKIFNVIKLRIML